MTLLKTPNFIPSEEVKDKIKHKKKRYKRFNSFEFTKIQRSKMIKFKARSIK